MGRVTYIWVPWVIAAQHACDNRRSRHCHNLCRAAWTDACHAAVAHVMAHVLEPHGQAAGLWCSRAILGNAEPAQSTPSAQARQHKRGSTISPRPRSATCAAHLGAQPAPRNKTCIQPASALHLPSALRRASAAAAAPYAHPSSASLRPSLVCRLDSSTAQERPRPSTAQERPRLHYRLLTLCPADPIPCAESIYAHSCRSRR